MYYWALTSETKPCKTVPKQISFAFVLDLFLFVLHCFVLVVRAALDVGGEYD